ncbi:MAG: excinuclease ABC subunit UvrC, partial [Bacteriovoracaceae bacterium]|nr:excinuclease ABC subunit UvrC [Bacteriovoracaceae bacterium]
FVKTSRTVQQLLAKAKSLPAHPGCYLMKNGAGEVIYVGKAVHLARRVSSYFQKDHDDAKTQALVRQIKDFEFILAGNEAEAFVLENTLIKKYSPKYNLRLKDGQTYPYLAIRPREDFPRLQYLYRGKLAGQEQVFGPYPMGTNIREVWQVLVNALALRNCTATQFKRAKRPCLRFQMGQCLAPCQGKVTAEDYQQRLQMVIDFLRDHPQAVLDFVQQKMESYAGQDEFERAAVWRDYLQTLQAFAEQAQQRNAELHQGAADVDVWAFFVSPLDHVASTEDRADSPTAGVEIDLVVFHVRQHCLFGHRNFNFLLESRPNDAEVNAKILSWMSQYYQQNQVFWPQVVALPNTLAAADRHLLQDILAAMPSAPAVPVAQTYGHLYVSLGKLALRQAQENRHLRLAGPKNIYAALKKLQFLLQLPQLPLTIEAYDVAVWQGKSPTASQIVFQEGVPDKKNYRYYHLQERPEGNNDFAMLAEMMERRLAHGHLPDVMMVDGGWPQVRILEKILKERQISLPLIGIVKEREAGDQEHLVIAGRQNEYVLAKCPPLAALLASMRDEAHRFARKLHHRQEKKRLIKE